MKQKALAIILALCMVIALGPVTARAIDAQKKTALIHEVTEVRTVEQLPEMPVQPLAGSHKINVKVVKNSSCGKVEVSATSADTQEIVYLVVNPDDGYLVEFGGDYEYQDHMMEMYYLGMDTYEIIMPDGDVNLEISFVKATGDKHNIRLNVSEGGTATVSRKTAKKNEAVILTVKPDSGYNLGALSGTYGNGQYVEGINLGEMDGAYYYELLMPGDDLTLTVNFSRKGPYFVETILGSDPYWGGVYVSPTRPYAGDEVTVTAVSSVGFKLKNIYAVYQEDLTRIAMEPVGADQFVFTMPEGSVEVHVEFEPEINPITVTVETGIGGTAVAIAEAQEGTVVKLTCNPEEGYRVARITGVAKTVNNGDNTYSFVMPGEAVELKVLFLRHENPFLDVNESHFFYDPVLWAVENGITNGTGADTFTPFGICNRAQVITFLWRYAGSPEPADAQNHFTDVPAGVFYEKPVLWALENGITNGISNNEFGPNQFCNRAQVVTFLWRLLGEPEPVVTEHHFTDVFAGSFYEQPVLWALENGITNGTTADTFSPNGQCQRSQVVTFLYRTAKLAE